MEYRLLRSEETYLTLPGLAALGVYHNSVTTNAEVRYPTTPVEHCAAAMGAGITDGSCKAIGVFENGELIAFCQASVNAEKRRGELTYLFVNEEYRGQGIGTKLMDWAMEVFEASPAEMVDIRVVEGNPVADLYERYDFHPRISVMTWFKKRK